MNDKSVLKTSWDFSEDGLRVQISKLTIMDSVI